MSTKATKIWRRFEGVEGAAREGEWEEEGEYRELRCGYGNWIGEMFSVCYKVGFTCFFSLLGTGSGWDGCS